MSYQEALEAAGAEVHVFQTFGSYQGEWWAKVTYKGNTGWVNDSYGSCSGCDAFEDEFGDFDLCWCEDDCECEDNCKNKPEYRKRLAEFGSRYLDNIKTQLEAESEASKYLDWDMNADEMLNFIKENAT